MATRTEFVRKLSLLKLAQVEQAIALLWFYRQTQEYDERTASELANDLFDEGFPKPNVTRLSDELKKSTYTIRGRRKNSFQIDVRKLNKLEENYGEFLNHKIIEISDNIIPTEWVAGTRPYLEKLVWQINGSYELGFYDACAALCRRLMESLIIEVYIFQKRHTDIQENGIFISLEKLIKHIQNDSQVALSRNTSKSMPEIKEIGDSAAHDRVYITRQNDIDQIKTRFARMISELLNLAGIR